MDSDNFIRIARMLVTDYVSPTEDNYISLDFINETTFVVWSSKTLQNNKALIGVNIGEGLYFEVTYNGDKEELYLDAYKKEENQAYSLKDEKIKLLK